MEMPLQTRLGFVFLFLFLNIYSVDIRLNFIFLDFCYQLTLSRNLYAGQEATVRTGHGTTD